MKCLTDNGTWELTGLPEDRQAVKCRWIYLTKHDTQGNVTHYRTRLVAKGFSQTAGVDYEEVFAPIARLDSLRLLLSLAANFDMEPHHIDIKSAYLNGDLDEEIYMDQLKGFTVPGQESRKNISSDVSIFIKCHKGGDPLIMLVYVDNIALFGTLDDIQAFKTQIAMCYKVTDLGEASHFLGLHITRNRSKKTITIDQAHLGKDRGSGTPRGSWVGVLTGRGTGTGIKTRIPFRGM